MRPCVIGLEMNDGSSDDCAIVGYCLGRSSFDCADIGSPVTVTLTVTDGEGNTDTETATVTVLDNAAPALCSVECHSKPEWKRLFVDSLPELSASAS